MWYEPIRSYVALLQTPSTACTFTTLKEEFCIYCKKFSGRLTRALNSNYRSYWRYKYRRRVEGHVRVRIHVRSISSIIYMYCNRTSSSEILFTPISMPIYRFSFSQRSLSNEWNIFLQLFKNTPQSYSLSTVMRMVCDSNCSFLSFSGQNVFFKRKLVCWWMSIKIINKEPLHVRAYVRTYNFRSPTCMTSNIDYII